MYYNNNNNTGIPSGASGYQVIGSSNASNIVLDASNPSSRIASYTVGGGSATFSTSSDTAQIANDLLVMSRGSGLAGSAVYSAGGSTSYSAGGSASYSAGGSSNYSAGGLGAGSAVGFSAGGSGSYSSGATVSISSGSVSAFLSEIETAILRSTVPIDISESEEITVIGQRGIWANKAEVINWRGPIPITEYVINEDQNPEIINKKVSQVLEYIQELAIRYLRPPTPPAPGEIIIKQEANIATPPAPPLIIRQQPARPPTPEPLVIREAPPQPPAQVGRKLITISGRRIPPPPRKVIIERLPPIPSKPQSVIIERWLPYAQVKRRVVFQANQQADAVVMKPRNVIVQWEAPEVHIKKEIKYLGVINANPAEYVQKYGVSLKASRDLPQYVLDIATPDGLVLAANYQYNSVYELEGELKALGLIDLDREGLGEYRAQLTRLGITFTGGSLSAGGGSFAFSSASSAGSGSSSALINQMFSSYSGNSSGLISVSEARGLLANYYRGLNRNYSDDEGARFFQTFRITGDNSININDLRLALEKL